MNKENLEIEGLDFLIHEDNDFDLARDIIKQGKLEYNYVPFDANKLMGLANSFGAWSARITLKDFPEVSIRIANGYADTNDKTQYHEGPPEYSNFTLCFDNPEGGTQFIIDRVFSLEMFPKPKWFNDDMRLNVSLFHGLDHYRETFMVVTQEQLFKLLFES